MNAAAGSRSHRLRVVGLPRQRQSLVLRQLPAGANFRVPRTVSDAVAPRTDGALEMTSVGSSSRYADLLPEPVRGAHESSRSHIGAEGKRSLGEFVERAGEPVHVAEPDDVIDQRAEKIVRLRRAPGAPDRRRQIDPAIGGALAVALPAREQDAFLKQSHRVFRIAPVQRDDGQVVQHVSQQCVLRVAASELEALL